MKPVQSAWQKASRCLRPHATPYPQTGIMYRQGEAGIEKAAPAR